MHRRRWVCGLLLVLEMACFVGAEPTPAPIASPPHRVPGNLIKNPSFEQNWFNRALAERRRFLLLQATDMGVAECDGHVDHWQFRGALPTEAWDLQVAGSGGRSIRFDKPGSAAQLVRFAGEQQPRGGGAFYSYFMPMEAHLAAQVARRPVIVGAWCRTRDVRVGSEPQLVVTIECSERPNYDSAKPAPTSRPTQKVSFSPGTHDWEYREVRFDEKGELGAEPLKGTPFLATVSLVSRSPEGSVWFDDVSCVEPEHVAANRLPNGGFEQLDRDGWPQGWSHPALWTWFRNNYYTFTGWSHSDSKVFRGGAAADRLVTLSGQGSLRMTVFPGDNFAVDGPRLDLRQTAARPIEVRAMVKADNLRTLEIMARDETGDWVPQGDFLGDDMEEPGSYNFGSTGCGTYDWCCVRKYFSPRRPVKSLQLVLAVRGFDGKLVERNVVGTVWIDDVEVFEHGAERPAASPAVPQTATAAKDLRVVDLDLGERLWGENSAGMLLEFTAPAAARIGQCQLKLSLRTPLGKVRESNGTARVIRTPTAENPRGVAVCEAPYLVDELCQSPQEQYQLTLRLLAPGSAESEAAVYYFGTASKLIEAGLSGSYGYPGEKLVAYANVNASSAALAKLDACELVTTGPKGTRTHRVTDLKAITRPQAAPKYINTRNLVQMPLESDDFVVHPWSDPIRDNRFAARLRQGGAVLAETEPMMFGFMERPPALSFPERIERTAVNQRGFLTVNGQPYFPVYWATHFGASPEADYPPAQFGMKVLDLTKLVCSKNAMPDDEIKAQLLAKIAEVKDDPKFFQYELGDGEMQLQGPDWKDRLQWCLRAIEWIRAADPNHVINGSRSWLVGHPRHNETMPSFVPAWDVIGVEASFETVPEIRRVAMPLMKERQTAVLVGLETYFYQSELVLRWRGYRSVLNGAAGVGLCPSGMMESRPEKVNYLRGLNAEFRRLGPVITDREPAEPVACASPAVETLQRVRDGKLYLLAVRGAEGEGAAKVAFNFPAAARYSGVNVLFEGRQIRPTSNGFEDEFALPRTVHVYEVVP